MNKTLLRTAAALSFAAVIATSAQAAEPTLDAVIGGLSNWTYIGGSDYSFASLGANQGSTLAFTLSNESTAWSATQTFGITDSGATVGIFSAAQTNGATASYTVNGKFDGIAFASNSGAAEQYAPGGSDAHFDVYRSNTNANLYTLSYEDYHYGDADDHNDMVVQMSVTAVPEPETYAMLLGGLGIVCLLVSRRRNNE